MQRSGESAREEAKPGRRDQAIHLEQGMGSQKSLMGHAQLTVLRGQMS